MTEAEWQACDEPDSMRVALGRKRSTRKFWLFAAACVRTASPGLGEAVNQEIADSCENFAEATATPGQLRQAWDQSQQRKERCVSEQQFEEAGCLHDWGHLLLDARTRYKLGNPLPTELMPEVLAVTRARGFRAARWAIWYPSFASYTQGTLETHPTNARTLREIFGNLGRPPSVSPVWLHWQGRVIPRLAAAIYEERAFDRMPILGDALEDAGCTDRTILDHCRVPGPHVRGCWVIDLILGKS